MKIDVPPRPQNWGVRTIKFLILCLHRWIPSLSHCISCLILLSAINLPESTERIFIGLRKIENADLRNIRCITNENEFFVC